MAEELLMFKVPSNLNWPKIAAALLRSQCGAKDIPEKTQEENPRVQAAAAKLKAANGNAENPDDAVPGWKEVVWHGVWKGEVINVPMSYCAGAGGVQLVQPAVTELGSVVTAKQGYKGPLEFKSGWGPSFSSPADKITMTLEKNSCLITFSDLVITNGKLTKLNIDVSRHADPIKYNVLIVDNGKVYKGTITVEPAGKKAKKGGSGGFTKVQPPPSKIPPPPASLAEQIKKSQ
jgi:hypothetical protein